MTILRFLILLPFCSKSAARVGADKLKDFLGGGDNARRRSSSRVPPTVTKYSDNPDMGPRVRRQYKRTTKESLADESGLDQKAGSLWVMEGQGAYLFAQNPMRLVGDPIGVDDRRRTQGAAARQNRRDQRFARQDRGTTKGTATGSGGGKQRQASGRTQGPTDKEKDEGKRRRKGKEDGRQQSRTKATRFNVKIVPTRIVERTIEGNYRVKGSQPFMIGSARVQGHRHGRRARRGFQRRGNRRRANLLDPKFDIVSIKRAGAEL